MPVLHRAPGSLISAIAIVSLLAPTTGASGVATRNALPWMPPHVRPAVVKARADVDALRGAIAGGSFASIVDGLLRAPAPPIRALPAPARRIAGMDPAAASAVAGLDAAVRGSLDIIGTLPAAAVRRQARAVRASIARWMRTDRRVVNQPAPFAVSMPDAARVEPSVRHATANAPRAARLLSRALDLHLPALQAAAARMPRAGTASGCDVLNETPYLCVGGPGANTYTEDAALLIDLGGTDTYRNPAGAAPFIRPGGAAYLMVSVNLDLGPEDDAYTFTAPVDGEFNAAQGSGAFGAIGMLVDAGGDDAYRVDPATDGSLAAGYTAQGSGLGGIGILVDRHGDDTYVAASASGSTGGFALAQGAGHFCAASTRPTPAMVPPGGCPVGALVDRGEGNDRYLIDGGVATQPAGRYLAGQGYGNLGLGVLFDDGGTDSIETRTLSTTSDPAGPGLPGLSVFVQGSGFGGEAYVLTGFGDTRYSISMQSDGRAFNRAWSQAAGLIQGSVGIIEDLGGDDTYSTVMRLRDHRDLVVEDGCECDAAKRRVEAYPVSGGIILDIDQFGQGIGYFEGLGAIEDHGLGNDTYVVDGEHDLRVTLRDELTSPEAPPRLEVVSYGSPGLVAQGVARSDAIGYIADDGGTDTYTYRSINRTHAEASSAHADGEPVVEATAIGRVGLIGQGAADFGPGFGGLLDLGGTDDRITATALSPTTTAPDPDGGYRVGSGTPIFQGASQGGVLVALGDDPVILSAPSVPVCAASPGPRGFGAWTECPVNADDPDHEGASNLLVAAAGLAPNALGQQGELSIPDAPAVTDGRLDVAARLRGIDSVPVAGAEMHLDFQVKYQPLLGIELPGWASFWTTDAVTDADGVARARLPMDLGRWPYNLNPVPPGSRIRVLVTFDGSDDLYPKHVVREIGVTP